MKTKFVLEPFADFLEFGTGRANVDSWSFGMRSSFPAKADMMTNVEKYKTVATKLNVFMGERGWPSISVDQVKNILDTFVAKKRRHTKFSDGNSQRDPLQMTRGI